jgi:hypothetical protein
MGQNLEWFLLNPEHWKVLCISTVSSVVSVLSGRLTSRRRWPGNTEFEHGAASGLGGRRPYYNNSACYVEVALRIRCIV